MSNETTIELHPKQYEAFNFTKQFGAAICGVQSGKTFVGAVWAAKKLQENSKGVGMIVAPTYKILNASTLEKFFTLAPEFRRYFKKQEGVIELPTGGKIFIRSADRPEGLEGITLDWCWADEAGQMSRLFWTVIKARVSAKQAQIFFTSTPYSSNWFFTDIYEAWRNGTDPRVEVFTWKTIDNPVFQTKEGKEYLAQEKIAMGEKMYRMRYEGVFEKMEGLVWDLPSTQIVDMSQPVFQQMLQYPDMVIGGVDWGFTNPAGILVVVVKDARYYVVEEEKVTQRTTKELISDMKDLKDRWGTHVWYPDPAEPDRIEEMKRDGLSVGDTNKNIILGIDRVRRLINEERLFISESCSELIDEMAQYHYEEKKGDQEEEEKPVKFNDHLCDALRYVCMGYEAKEPFKKNIFDKVRSRNLLESHTFNKNKKNKAKFI